MTLRWALVLVLSGLVAWSVAATSSSSRSIAVPRRAERAPAAAVPPAAPPAGSLVVIGGALRFRDPDVWQRIVTLAGEHARRAGSARPRIAVVAAASRSPLETGARLVETLRSHGADAWLAPIGMRGFPRDCREAAADPLLAEQLRASHGVFFSGGEQARIVQALRSEQGEESPALAAIWELYRSGGVIAGTSAGAAVTSRIMFRDAERVLPVLLRGVAMGREIDAGFGFMHGDWLVDQHFLVRGRFARALVAMLHCGLRFGVGVDENTAVVVRGQEAEVVGYKGALVLDLSRAEHDARLGKFNVRNARLTYLDRGDRFRLDSLQVVPSAEKLAGDRIDPSSADFRPVNSDPVATNDILMNSTVLDLMCRLLNNRRPEAYGLAFDGFAARDRPTTGFEFRLVRDADTRAWETGAMGSHDLTIANVRLDVQPVEISGPLYRPPQAELTRAEGADAAQ